MISRLAEFIERNSARIVAAAEEFAATQVPVGMELDSEALRDHIPDILTAVVADLRNAQSEGQRASKAAGRAPDSSGNISAARSHGRLRAKSGFDVNQMVAEYRALRASVLRLWAAEGPIQPAAIEDMIRFNEAIDQGVAESVADFSAETENWRHVFLGVLGHDLRGPLNAILLTSEVMSTMSADTPFSEPTNVLIRSGRRMTALLDDLLDFSRTALGMGIRITRSEVSLARELADEIEVLRAALPHVAIDFQVDSAPVGLFDASRLREALSNLVLNAAKHGSSDAPIHVSLSSDGEQIRLAVENEGDPIAASELQAIFEPLKRAARDESSTDTSLGLGLFVVREITKAHGGSIAATSNERGTKFELFLPPSPGQS